MKNRNFRWKTATVTLFLTAICLVFAGCSKHDEQDNIKDTIKTVVGLQMNAPDEKALFQNYMSNNPEDDQNSIDQYRTFLEETYAPYFTESTFEQYVMTNEFIIFHWAADEFDYQLQVNDVTVDQNDVTPSNYNFTVDLDYVDKDGEKKAIEVTGVAIMRGDKIAKMSYLGDKQLLRSLFDGGLE